VLVGANGVEGMETGPLTAHPQAGEVWLAVLSHGRMGGDARSPMLNKMLRSLKQQYGSKARRWGEGIRGGE
jgi:hypothetical protein